jgi:hypothetical protein
MTFAIKEETKPLPQPRKRLSDIEEEVQGLVDQLSTTEAK